MGILRHFIVERQLLLDKRIAGSGALNFSISQCHKVGILYSSQLCITAHSLGDDGSLILQFLPHISIKRILHNIVKYLYFLIRIALAQNSAMPLLQITRPPRCIQIMQGNKMMLAVCASAHFLCRANQYAHITTVNLLEKFIHLGFVLCALYKGNLVVRYAPAAQCLNELFIHAGIFCLVIIIQLIFFLLFFFF